MEKEKKEFEIMRVFNAPLDLVWKVYTEKEHLVKWWGPKGLTMLDAKLDFRVGGIFHYGMATPDGHKMWGKFIYKEIVPKTKIVFVVSFSDENGGVTRHPMSQTWPLETLNTVTLSEENGKTTMKISGGPINATDEEKATFYGAFESMNQGFKGTFDQLEEYLATVK